MLRLILMRHAKSSWSDNALDDRERPLSARGRAAAPHMGEALAEHGLVPELILCSPAKRTRQTLDLVAEGMRAKPKTNVSEALYAFGDGSGYLRAINEQPKRRSPLMIIGHNPSLAALADRLAGSGDERALNAMRRKFPTAAVAFFTFRASRWRDVGWGSGKLEWFVTPKMLDRQTQD